MGHWINLWPNLESSLSLLTSPVVRNILFLPLTEVELIYSVVLVARIFIHIYIFFLRFFSLIITRYWLQFPGLYSRTLLIIYFSHQFSSVTHSCLTLCDLMDCSTPGLPVHHQLPELAQTPVHRVGDAIQPSRPLSSPSLPAFLVLCVSAEPRLLIYPSPTET